MSMQQLIWAYICKLPAAYSFKGSIFDPMFPNSHKVFLLQEKLRAIFFRLICDTSQMLPKYFYPFPTIAPFLHPLETSKNLFRGYKNGTLAWNECKPFRPSLITLRSDVKNARMFCKYVPCTRVGQKEVVKGMLPYIFHNKTQYICF